MSVRSVFPPAAVPQSATPADGGPHVASFVVDRPCARTEWWEVQLATPASLLSTIGGRQERADTGPKHGLVGVCAHHPDAVPTRGLECSGAGAARLSALRLATLADKAPQGGASRPSAQLGPCCVLCRGATKPPGFEFHQPEVNHPPVHACTQPCVVLRACAATQPPTTSHSMRRSDNKCMARNPL